MCVCVCDMHNVWWIMFSRGYFASLKMGSSAEDCVCVCVCVCQHVKESEVGTGVMEPPCAQIQHSFICTYSRKRGPQSQCDFTWSSLQGLYRNVCVCVQHCMFCDFLVLLLHLQATWPQRHALGGSRWWVTSCDAASYPSGLNYSRC